MPDVKEVIKGLETIVNDDWMWKKADYYAGICKDALALLKAQEPIEPTKPDEDNMVYCGACGTPVGYEVLEPPGMNYIRYNYCPECGRAVKWDG